MFFFFKKTSSIALFVLVSLLSRFNACALTPGDLVIVGYNFKDPDEFSILALVELAAGTQFYITDCGWNTQTGTFRTGEGLITYTVPQGGIAIGQQIHYPYDPGFTTQGVNGFFGLSLLGDQLFIFEGSFEKPEFVFGLTDYNGGWLGTSFVPTNQSSHLPPGLQAGFTALELDLFLQARFECAFPFSNRQEFLREITNANNWQKNDDRVILPILGCGFDVLSIKTLNWNAAPVNNDQIVITIETHDYPSDLYWMYYGLQGEIELDCMELTSGKFECKLPSEDIDYALVKPCSDSNDCGVYKNIRKVKRDKMIVYVELDGNIRVQLPPYTGRYKMSLYNINGLLLYTQKGEESQELSMEGLASGFYVVTVELAEQVYRASFSLP